MVYSINFFLTVKLFRLTEIQEACDVAQGSPLPVYRVTLPGRFLKKKHTIGLNEKGLKQTKCMLTLIFR